MGKLLFRAIEFGRAAAWTVGDHHQLVFSARGNLELWRTAGLKLLWDSGTTDKGAAFVMQSDGNLVIYDAARKSVWASDTAGNPDAMLAVEEEGRLAIYSADLTTTLWQSDTAEASTEPTVAAESPDESAEVTAGVEEAAAT
ncbi:MAG TPA: hypothetical protein VGG69_08180 [Rhizomicrobium sp.]